MKRRCIAVLLAAVLLAAMISPGTMAENLPTVIPAETLFAESGGSTPVPELTEEPAASPENAAVPTQTPVCTVTPETTAEPASTQTPVCTAVPDTTATPAPTETPAGTPIPEITAVPTAIPETTVMPEEPLFAVLASLEKYAYVGEKDIRTELRISGGMSPYDVTYRVLRGDSLLLENDPVAVAGESAAFQYAPEKHGSYVVEVLVVDSAGHSFTAAVEIPVAQDDDSGKAWIDKANAVELTGNWGEDLLAVAESQLGYAESDVQFIIDENGDKQGATIYGEWLSYDHMEWCSAFAAWCADRAQIPAEHFPVRSRSAEWADKLANLDAFEAQESGYEPQPGDLVFIDREGGDEPHHMGVVAGISDDKVHTVEGNVDRAVQRMEYAADDEAIVGYGNVQKLMLRAQLEETPEPTAEPTAEATAAPEVEYACGKQEHVHGEGCTADCTLEEHTHEDCLTVDEQAAVDSVQTLIDALPLPEDCRISIEGFAANGDAQGEAAYRESIAAQVQEAQMQYDLLTERQQARVLNADRLEAMGALLTAPVEDGGTADTPMQRDDDHVSVGSGRGIRFRLFNYDADINKNGVAKYFNFRGTNFHDPEGDDVKINGQIDADGYTTNRAQVLPVLENGYPVFDARGKTDNFSLGYLFGAGGNGVTAYRPNNTLLRYSASSNRYYYDSADNAVDYDTNSNRFIVRSYAERGDSTAGFSGNYADFMPFTYWNGTTRLTNDKGKEYFYTSKTELDYWFGMTMDTEFYQPAGGFVDGEEMVFEFSGDDDVWVFIDDVLVLDLGGTHGVTSGSINFSTGEVKQHLDWAGSSTPSYPTTIRDCFDKAGRQPNGGWNADDKTFADYTEHTMKFFYLERGSGSANCKIDFNLPTLPEHSLTVAKDLTAGEGDPVRDFIADSLLYRFRVVDAADPDRLFVPAGAQYELFENGVAAGSGMVDDDGYFYLKAGQSARFENMLETGDGASEYIVQEIMPDVLTGQYAGVEYTVSSAVGQIQPEEGPASEFTSFSTSALPVDETHLVTFRNRVDTAMLGGLKITKRLTAGSGFAADQLFGIRVLLGGDPLPQGTNYTVGGEIRAVGSDGMLWLKGGETAEIVQGILSGTDYEIYEPDAAENGWRVSYSGTLTAGGETGQLTFGAQGASGEFPVAGEVHVTVTNADHDFAGTIPISKQFVGNRETAQFRFIVEQVEPAEGSWTTVKRLNDAMITVNDDRVTSESIVIGYDGTETGKRYYRISEQNDGGSVIYDTTFYIVEMTLDGERAQITGAWKNGTEMMKLPDSGLSFVNQRTTRLRVEKMVDGFAKEGSFRFSVSAADETGAPVMLPDGAGYTVNGGKAVFELRHGESVVIDGMPMGTVATVEEAAAAGYTAQYSLDGQPAVSGNRAVLTMTGSEHGVQFINVTNVELPLTGGAGTQGYTMGGLLLTLAGMSLLYKKAKQKG